jgi:hypothetical protein
VDRQELERQLSSYSHRSDLAPELDGFIEAGYAALNSVCRLGEMEKRATVTATDGVIDLPDDFLAARSLTQARGGGYTYEPPSVSASELGRYGLGSQAWVQRIAAEQIGVGPATDSTDFELVYIAAVPVPPTITSTDVYLTRYPSMVRNACMEQLAEWTDDAAKEERSRAKWMAQAMEANREAQRARLGSKARATKFYQRARAPQGT